MTIYIPPATFHRLRSTGYVLPAQRAQIPVLTVLAFIPILYAQSNMHEPKPGISSVLERYMTQPAQDLPPIPAPLPQPESDFYWEKCKANELWLRHCKSCDQAYFYPRDICPNCFSRDTDWIQSSGQGTLHTFSIVHRGPTPVFRDRVPYIAAIVEVESGARIPTNLVEIEPDPALIKIGMAVEVVFQQLDDNINLPMFRPAS